MNQKLLSILNTKVRPIELALLFKKILRIKRKVYFYDNLKFFLDPVSNFGYSLIFRKLYEEEFTLAVKSILRKGDTFVDIGANEGYFSIIASKLVGSSGKVIAIEPQERLWHVILKNIQINAFLNIQLMPLAVDESEGIKMITLTPSINTGSSSLFRKRRGTFWSQHEIHTKRLDNIFNLNSPIDLMKIDVEGYEYFVLKSAKKLLRNRMIKNILVEVHDEQLQRLNISSNDIEKLLLDYNFKKSDKHYSLYELK